MKLRTIHTGASNRNNLLILIAVSICAALAGGCGDSGGSSRVLGPVSYDKAFVASKHVMEQYFEIETSNAQEGEIRAYPRLIKSEAYPLSRATEVTRKLGTLKLDREGRFVRAQVNVLVQRQGSEIYSVLGQREENYSGVPDQTPAELEAATTAEQNQVWTTLRHDQKLEREILAQIDRTIEALRAPPATSPPLPDAQEASQEQAE